MGHHRKHEKPRTNSQNQLRYQYTLFITHVLEMTRPCQLIKMGKQELTKILENLTQRIQNKNSDMRLCTRISVINILLKEQVSSVPNKIEALLQLISHKVHAGFVKDVILELWKTEINYDELLRKLTPENYSRFTPADLDTHFEEITKALNKLPSKCIPCLENDILRFRSGCLQLMKLNADHCFNSLKRESYPPQTANQLFIDKLIELMSKESDSNQVSNPMSSSSYSTASSSSTASASPAEGVEFSNWEEEADYLASSNRP